MADAAVTAARPSVEMELGRGMTFDEHIRLREVLKRVYKDVFSADVLEDTLVPVYMKYFTIEDIEEMLRFYSTKAGEKYLQLHGPIEDEIALSFEKIYDTKKSGILMRLTDEFIKEFAQ